MGGTISVKDKARANGAIGEFAPEQESIKKIGTDAKADWAALALIFTLPVDGETCGEELPPEIGDAFVTRTEAIAAKVGGLSGSWRSWLHGLEVVQQEGAEKVQQAGEGGTFAGVTASGTIDVGATASGTASVGEIDYSKVK